MGKWKSLGKPYNVIYMYAIIWFWLKIFMICGDTPTYGWWLGWWVGRWVGSCEITKYQINLELIEITQFCLKIHDLWRHPLLWVGWYVGSCKITKYQLNLDLIEIIQFCLKFLICGDTCLHKWIGRLMGGSCQITKYWINLIEIIPFCLQIDDL